LLFIPAAVRTRISQERSINISAGNVIQFCNNLYADALPLLSTDRTTSAPLTGGHYDRLNYSVYLYTSPCGGGSNTSTVALRVVEDDEEGTRCLGYNWATLSLGDINADT
jgi:hypothetical protein